MLPLEEQGEVLFAAPDARALVFTLAACTVAAVLFGLVPAIQATRPALQPGLKDGAASPGGARFRKALISAQVAVALVLAVAAGLFARTLYNLRTLDPGFARDKLILFTLEPSLNGYGEERIRSLYDRVEDRLKTIPGVKGVALVSWAPFNSTQNGDFIKIEGYEHAGAEGVQVNSEYLGPGGFAALGVPLIAGREFLPSDDLNARPVAIVNQSFARRYLGGNAVGKHIAGALSSGPPHIEIVGVVRDIRPDDPRNSMRDFVFHPVRQGRGMPATFHIRTALDPAALFDTIRREVRNVDPAVPVANMKTMDAQQDEALFTERIIALLSISFAVLALLLSAIGLYGVIAFSVARRTREFGIRMALGAERRNILGLIAREIALMLFVGLAAGGLLTAASARLVRGLLYGVEPFDPLTLAAASLLLVCFGFAAGLAPGRRATRTDLVASLRYE